MDYRVLGPLEVRDGEESLPLAGAKQRALLALLLVHANHVLSRDRLIDELWGDDPPETAVQSVQVYISRLRKLLPTGTLVTRPPGYLLEVEPDALDLHRFERLLADGRKALSAGDAERASRVLREALDLWRGPALAEFASEPFARIESGRLEDLRVAAVEERVEADLALARHADLVGELETLIAEHPHRERPRGQLMLALYRSGRQAEALEAYRQARAALDELGIEPSEGLRQLEKQILTQDTALDTPPPLLGETIALPGHLRIASPFPFVGRSSELAALRSLLLQAEAGEGGRVALLGGEAGSGKTRLVRELAHEAAARGTLVLYGTSDADVTTPYQPFVEALEFLVRVSNPDALRGCLGAGGGELTRLLPDLASRLGPLPDPLQRDPETERHRLHAAVAEFLTRVSRVQPLLLIVDDTHWADVPSLQLLRRLGRRAPEARMLLVATYRDKSEDARPEFSDTLADLLRLDGVTRLMLGSLSDEDIAEFIHCSAGPETGGDLSTLASSISELTDGTPLLLCELWRALVDAGTVEISDAGVRLTEPLAALGSPNSVREIVRHRLSRLAPSTAALLEVAAVAGTQFELSVLGDESEVRPSLEEAIGSGMIEEIPGPGLRHRFSHELIRRALYDRLTRVRRAELHLLVGEALERTHATDPSRVLPDLAHHFALASPFGDVDRAVDYNVRAAKAATASLAFEETAARLSTALELGISEEAERARVRHELGGALWITGQYEHADEVLEEALRDACAAGDEQTEWYIRLDRAGHRRDPAQLETVAREAVRVFERLDDHLGLARAGRRLATAANRRLAFVDGEYESKQALVHVIAAGDRHEEARIVDALCTALLYGPIPAAAGIERCRELLGRASDNPLMEANILCSLAGLQAMTGQVDDARGSYARARTLYEGLDLQLLVAGLSSISGPIELLAGNAGVAEQELRRGLNLLAEGGPYLGDLGYALLALALLDQGKRDDAVVALDAVDPVNLMGRIVHDIAAARLHSDVAIARKAVEVASATDALNLHADARAALAHLLAAEGDDEATTQRRLALELYEQKGNELAVHLLTADKPV